MTDIIKKNGGQQLATQTTEWDPFRAMREFFGWDPFREIAPRMQQFDKTFYPSFDVTENKDAYVFKADVPGVKPEDIEVTTLGNRLQIKGKRDYEHETKNDTVYTYERQYGNFTRSFTLPDGVDMGLAKSELKDGVLSLWIPKQPSAQPKKIEVATSKPKS
jgi:HSP20 family protein